MNKKLDYFLRENINWHMARHHEFKDKGQKLKAREMFSNSLIYGHVREEMKAGTFNDDSLEQEKIKDYEHNRKLLQSEIESLQQQNKAYKKENENLKSKLEVYNETILQVKEQNKAYEEALKYVQGEVLSGRILAVDSLRSTFQKIDDALKSVSHIK